MIDETKFSQVVQKYLNKKYALGDPDAGLDCLSILFAIYGDLGAELPREFEGVTLASYAGFYTTEPEQANDMFLRFLCSLGKQVPKRFHYTGDLMVFVDPKGMVFPGIYLGNGNLLAVYKQGVYVIPAGAYATRLIDIRRIID